MKEYKNMNDLSEFKNRLQMNVRAFDCMLSTYTDGDTEFDIKNRIQNIWDESAKRKIEFSGDIISGIRSSYIEGEATDKVIKHGDAVILDLQPGFNKCYADTTRTFFIGEASDEQKNAYEAVTDALIQMEKALKPGAKASYIYEVMQETLKKHGFLCPHHAGHAVGEKKLMEPRLIPESDDKLEDGMIIAMEPGVYVEGKFGIRIENNYLITKDGCENLFSYPLDINNFIIGDDKK